MSELKLPRCPFCGGGVMARTYICNDSTEIPLSICAECGNTLRYREERDEWRMLMLAPEKDAFKETAAKACENRFNVRVDYIRQNKRAAETTYFAYIIIAEKHERSNHGKDKVQNATTERNT